MINFEVYKENAEERLSYVSSDTPRTFIRALEDIVKLCEYGQKLETENAKLRQHLKDYCIEIEDEEDTLTEEIINSIPEDWAEASIKNNIRNGGGRNYL
jgi:chemotaxis regulatin CheY-phosphate phosphatase CheZ